MATDVSIGCRRDGDHIDSLDVSREVVDVKSGHTELDDDFSKIVWMSRPVEEPLVADSRFVTLSSLEQVLLHIAHTLHNDPDRPQYHACNISSCSEVWLRILCDIWGVQDGDWQRDSPDPEHLENPESEEREELIALVIEAVVFAGFDDSEE